MHQERCLSQFLEFVRCAKNRTYTQSKHSKLLCANTAKAADVHGRDCTAVNQFDESDAALKPSQAALSRELLSSLRAHKPASLQ